MLDTMIATKVTAALCGSLLVFLLGSWAAEEIYHMGGHGHGDDHHQAYSIEVPDSGDHGGEEEETVDIAAILASGDAGQGERVFNKCRACHQLEAGANGTGPHLYAVVDRAVGSVDGFGYSGALSAAAETWTAENLYLFLENPKGYAPGTSMSFNGLAKPADKANLIAYLQGIGG